MSANSPAPVDLSIFGRYRAAGATVVVMTVRYWTVLHKRRERALCGLCSLGQGAGGHAGHLDYQDLGHDTSQGGRARRRARGHSSVRNVARGCSRGPSVGVALYSGPALAGHLGHLVLGGVHLTRPLGATVGDFLETPVGDGGLAFSRPLATTEIGAVMVALIIVMLQRRGRHPETSSASTT